MPFVLEPGRPHPVNHLDRSDPPLLLIQGGKDSLCALPKPGIWRRRPWTQVRKSISGSILRLVMCPPIPMSSEPFLDLWTGTSAPVARPFLTPFGRLSKLLLPGRPRHERVITMHASLPEPMLASASALFRLKDQDPGGIRVGGQGLPTSFS